MSSGIIWEGPIYGFTGYARSRSLALELYNLGINVKLNPSFKNRVLIKDFQTLEKLENNDIDHNNAVIVKCDVPFKLKRDKKNFSIAYTMFETSNVDRRWIIGINEFDRLWVPNKWNKQNFKNSGVTIPIDVIPFGVDLDLFTAKKKIKKKKFTFLFVGVYLERKNWMTLYKVFSEKFKDKKAVELVFKFSGDVDPIKIAETDNIKIINEAISDFELAKLYRESDCIILPSYAEGIGLPILEGYASGLPAMFTNAPFFKDFNCEGVSFPIKVSNLTKPSQEFLNINKIYKNSYFYKICEYDLLDKLNQLIDYSDGDKAIEFAGQFSWKKSAAKAIKILDIL